MHMALFDESLKKIALAAGGRPNNRSEFTQLMHTWQKPKRILAKSISSRTIQYVCNNSSCKWSVTATLSGNPSEYKVKLDAADTNDVHTCLDVDELNNASENVPTSGKNDVETTNLTKILVKRNRSKTPERSSIYSQAGKNIKTKEENTTVEMPSLIPEVKSAEAINKLLELIGHTSINANEGLYPTVAASDFVNAAGHLIAASVAMDKGEMAACFGFLTVVVAAFVGVLRFGFNEEKYAQANGNLADLAAFVGLPCVGFAFANAQWQVCPERLCCAFALCLAMVEAITRSFSATNRELCKILVNSAGFIGPVAFAAYARQDYSVLIGVWLFVVAALVITPARHQHILGVRCENWFHYCIAIGAVLISGGL